MEDEDAIELEELVRPIPFDANGAEDVLVALTRGTGTGRWLFLRPPWFGSALRSDASSWPLSLALSESMAVLGPGEAIAELRRAADFRGTTGTIGDC